MSSEKEIISFPGVNDKYINDSLRSGVSQQILFFKGDISKVLGDLENLEISLHLVMDMVDDCARKINKTARSMKKRPKELPPTLPEERDIFANDAGDIIGAERKKFFQTEIDSYLGTIQALLLQLERPYNKREERVESNIYNLQQEIILLNDIGVFISKTLRVIAEIKGELEGNAEWVREVLQKTGEFKPVKKPGFFGRLFGRKGAN